MLIKNDSYLERKAKYYPNVSDADWNDWKWQVRNRITSVEALKKYLAVTPQEEADIKAVLGKFRMAITPYYLSLIDPDDVDDPVRLQAVPAIDELYVSPVDLHDPLDEDKDSPVPG
ncbi:MAG: lysine 2,3-aminomutase, partial [Bacillota bacterium]|nr:lysine 2,3-aminomutase [Bacillota bacterium]